MNIYYLTLGFVEEPSSVNASRGITAAFNCTVSEIPEDQYWRINGKPLNHNDNMNRGITAQGTDNGLTYIAFVPATPTNDDITLQCVQLTSSLQIVSIQLAKLRVQGGLPIIYVRILSCIYL